MKKYYLWYPNGTGYYDCAGSVEAANKKEAVTIGKERFGKFGSMFAATEGVDPNTWGPWGNSHPGHKQRAAESNRRHRAERNKAAAKIGVSAALVGRVFSEAFEEQSTVIRLATPLPCAVRGCLNMAYSAAAWVVNDKDVPGLWIVQPICEGCNKAMKELYDKDA